MPDISKSIFTTTKFDISEASQAKSLPTKVKKATKTFKEQVIDAVLIDKLRTVLLLNPPTPNSEHQALFL